MKTQCRIVSQIEVIRTKKLRENKFQNSGFNVMKCLVVLIVFLLPSLLIAQNNVKSAGIVSPNIYKRLVSVGGADADVPGFNNQSIQFAINRVAETGGTVQLNPGTFEIIAPVQMKSNVTLIGSGKETILKKGNGVQSNYVLDADYGELKITVENSDEFEIGMKIQVIDDVNNSCWNVSAAYITNIVDHTIYVDKGMIRDYRSDKNGLISNACSVIEFIDTKDASVSNLTVDGNSANNFFADGCNSAGVFVLRSERITIDGVQVKDFNGEGISWQTTENVCVKNCEISGSGNTGLHPGTGSPFSVIENNNVHHNYRDGLFVCWRVYESRVEGNKIHNNGRFGICTGHKDVDVLFKNNYIYENGSDGVHLRGERESNSPHRNTFLQNIFENNGSKGGGYGFSVNSPAKDLLLKENIFKNSKRTQKAAIYIQKNGLQPQLENNQFEKHELGELLIEKD